MPATPSRILRQLRGREHRFGDKDISGWVPPHAPTSPRGPVSLDVTIEQMDDGFVLRWLGPSAEYSGEHAYDELRYAEHAAEELFGIQEEDWERAG